MTGHIPVTVLVVTRNEEMRIARCLSVLQGFSEIIVVDSGSIDGTKERAREAGTKVIDFAWNGRYPKKRQWCLDNLSLKHDWIFFVDADEVVAPELMAEIAALFAAGTPSCAGYFIRGRYVIGEKTLRFGLCNSKLALFDRRRISFPVVDDLDLPGMGEIEGHYQPVLKSEYEKEKIGVLRHGLLHYAYDGDEGWQERHRRYAAWEQGMNHKNAWPADPVGHRQRLKRWFRAMPGRPLAAFAHSYVLKGGLLDGLAGYRLACDRYRYYREIDRPFSRQ